VSGTRKKSSAKSSRGGHSLRRRIVRSTSRASGASTRKKPLTVGKHRTSGDGPSKRAESIDALLDIVAKQTQDWGFSETDQNLPWYRGHASLSWQLIPSSLRGRRWTAATCEDENESIEEFLTKIPGLGVVETSSLGIWNGYFLMQHHYVPTRLLDWTESVLVASYFAVSSDPIGNDAAIWMLNPYEMNEGNPAFGKDSVFSPGFVGNRLAEKRKIDKWLPLTEGKRFDQIPLLPLAVYPAYFSRRLESQKAAFTIHGSDPGGLTKLWRHGALLRIVIPGDRAAEFRRKLRDMGINRSTVFPDTEGLGRYLAERWGPAKRSKPHDGAYVRLRPSKIHKGGVGVFAIRPIPEGKCIFVGESEQLIWTDEKSLPKTECLRKLYADFGVIRGKRYATPVNFNSIGPGWYLNHSDRPNVRCDENLSFISIRRIRTGEELTANYAKYSDPTVRARAGRRTS
jgi:hypothetical protein